MFLTEEAKKERKEREVKRAEKEFFGYTRSLHQAQRNSEPLIEAPLVIEVKGNVIKHNLDDQETFIKNQLEKIKTNLTTDDDFFQSGEVVKRLKVFEDNLKKKKDEALLQMEEVDKLFKRIDSLCEQSRDKRLYLNKIVDVQKKKRKQELFNEGNDKFDEFVYEQEKATGLYLQDIMKIDIEKGVKGMSSFMSIREKIDEIVTSSIDFWKSKIEVATAKLELIDSSKRVELFQDKNTLIFEESIDSIKKIIKQRNDDFEKNEQERLDREKKQRERLEQQDTQRKEQERKREREIEIQPKNVESPKKTVRHIKFAMYFQSTAIEAREIQQTLSGMYDRQFILKERDIN